MSKLKVFTPSIVKGSDKSEDKESVAPTFRGHVILKVPSLDERYDWREMFAPHASKLEARPRPTGDAKEDLKAQSEWTMQLIPIIRQMINKSESFYHSVELTRLSDNAEFKSFDDLSHDPECEAIMQEIAFELVKGFGPSKEK